MEPKTKVSFKSLKGTTFIEKTYTLNVLKNSILDKIPFMKKEPMHSKFLNFLEEKQQGLAATCDFIPWSEIVVVMKDMVLLVKQSLERAKKETSKKISDMASARIVMEAVKTIVDENPEIFAAEVSEKFPRAVRLFSETKGNFVMVEELEKALNGTPCSKDGGVWTTMSGDLAIRMAAASQHKIEFLVHPIIRSYNTGSLENSRVRSPNGKVCKLAVDVLFGFLRHTLFDHEPLNYTIETRKEDEQKFIKVIEKHFRIKETMPYFMEESVMEDLKRTVVENAKGLEKLDKSTKTYQTYLECKNRQEVFAIPLINGLVNRFEIVTEFIHNQKACYRLHRRKCCPTAGATKVPVPVPVPEAVPEATPTQTEDSKEAPRITPAAVEEEQQAKKKNKRRKKKTVKSQVADAEEKLQEDEKEEEEVAEVLEVTEVIEESPQELLNSKEQEQEPKDLEIKEPSTCQKCYRTSIRCNEAKEKLKESENANKKLRKELEEFRVKFERKVEKEVEKLNEESERKLEAKDEEIKALKLRLERAEERSERVQGENEELKRQNVELQGQLAKVNNDLVQGKVEVEEVHREEGPIDFEQMLENLLNKQFQLTQANPVDAATKEIRKLKGLTEDQQIHDFADMELERFEEQHLVYSSALEQNIAAIQANSLSSVFPLPAYPTLSDEFKKALELAQEQRNKQLERECVICSDEMDFGKKEELFECPVCGKSVHLKCIETWFNTTRNCVHCRAEWK